MNTTKLFVNNPRSGIDQQLSIGGSLIESNHFISNSISKIQIYESELLLKSNKYTKENSFNSPILIGAYKNSIIELKNVLSSKPQGKKFLINQALDFASNMGGNKIYRPDSLLSIPGTLDISSTLDMLIGAKIDIFRAKNKGDNLNPLLYGNINQIYGALGHVRAKSLNLSNIPQQVIDWAQKKATNKILVPAAKKLSRTAIRLFAPKSMKNNVNAANNEIVEDIRYDIDSLDEILEKHNIYNGKQVRLRALFNNSVKDTIPKNDDLEYDSKSKIYTDNKYYDVINFSKPTKVASEIETLKSSDYIPFYFSKINLANQPDESCFFRAYLKGIEEQYGINWANMISFGRTEGLNIYLNTQRSVNVSFLIAIQSPKEIRPTYTKLNWLIQNLAYPEYKSVYFGKPPILYMTIGNLFNNVAVICNNLSINYLENEIWEIEDGFQVPLVFSISLGLTIKHDKIPSSTTTFYPLAIDQSTSQ